MATIQRETRRFFAHLFLSHSSLVLVGLELHTELSLTASLCLWFSVILSLGGFGLTLRALEARFGRLSLSDYHGLYEHTPALAVCFLLTGLASVGFPGTLGFISTELLVDSAVEASPYVGIIVIAAGALNGIAVIAGLFLALHRRTARLDRLPGNRLARAGGGPVAVGPDPGRRAVPTTGRRHSADAAADEILQDRRKRLHLKNPCPHDGDIHQCPRSGSGTTGSFRNFERQ